MIALVSHSLDFFSYWNSTAQLPILSTTRLMNDWTLFSLQQRLEGKYSFRRAKRVRFLILLSTIKKSRVRLTYGRVSGIIIGAWDRRDKVNSILTFSKISLQKKKLKCVRPRKIFLRLVIEWSVKLGVMMIRVICVVCGSWLLYRFSAVVISTVDV